MGAKGGSLSGSGGSYFGGRGGGSGYIGGVTDGGGASSSNYVDGKDVISWTNEVFN